MKTQFTSVSRPALFNVLLVAFLTAILYSCSGQQAKEKPGKSKVSAPEVDLHAAVLTNNKAAVEQHIAAGSNLNEKDPYGGSSPLITAAVFDKPEMAQLLINAGADVNFVNNEGSTALHSAAFFCRPAIVKMLLAKKADKTIKNKYNATAYESVIAPFADAKPAYDMMGQILGPMGLKLDYAYIEKTRPEIAAMLK